MHLLCRSCATKQIDLQVFLLLQLAYCFSELLLTSRCKSVPNTSAVIICQLPKEQIMTKLMLSKPLFIIYGRVKGLFIVILEYKNEASIQKVDVAHA